VRHSGLNAAGRLTAGNIDSILARRFGSRGRRFGALSPPGFWSWESWLPRAATRRSPVSNAKRCQQSVKALAGCVSLTQA